MGANKLLVIPNNMGDTLGYLLLFIAIVIVFFTLLGITLKRIRIAKLNGYASQLSQMKHLNDRRKEKAEKGKR